MKKLLFPMFLSLPLFSAAQRSDSVAIYFGLNDKMLSKQARHCIDSLVYNDIVRQGEQVMILGYADYLGSEGYNKTLSYNRAISVRDYLVSSGVKKESIILCVGKGKIDRDAIGDTKGYPDDRKVQIITHPTVSHVTPRPTAATKAAPTISITDISKLQKNATLKLDNIYFIPGSHQVRDESFPQLDALYNVMHNNPTLKIQIEGHVCCIASTIHKDDFGKEWFEDGYDADSRKFDLSVQRAKAIYDYLVEKGIAASRLKYLGLGSTHPLVNPEVTEADQNRNRRVELKILQK